MARALGLGSSGRQRVAKLRVSGVSMPSADEYACKLGVHPSSIWPDWFDQAQTWTKQQSAHREQAVSERVFAVIRQVPGTSSQLAEELGLPLNAVASAAGRLATLGCVQQDRDGVWTSMAPPGPSARNLIQAAERGREGYAELDEWLAEEFLDQAPAVQEWLRAAQTARSSRPVRRAGQRHWDHALLEWLAEGGRTTFWVADAVHALGAPSPMALSAALSALCRRGVLERVRPKRYRLVKLPEKAAEDPAAAERAILEVMRRYPAGVSCTQLAGALGIPVASCAAQLQDLRRAGVVQRLSGVRHRAVYTPAGVGVTPEQQLRWSSEIVDALQAEPDRTWTAAHIAQHLGVPVYHLTYALSRLVQAGVVQCTELAGGKRAYLVEAAQTAV